MSGKLPPLRVVLVAATVVLAATAGPVAASTASQVSSRPNASFAPNVVYEERGDIATISVATSDGGIVNIGSPSNGFWMQVAVGGSATLELNTYEAGVADTSAGVADALSGGKVKRARPTPLDRPLAAAKYNLNVTKTEKNDRELGIGKLILEERATRGIEARIAPRAAKLTELDNWGKVAGATQEPWGNRSVAYGDWVAIRVNATGLSGMIRKNSLGEDVNNLGYIRNYTQRIENDTRLVFEQVNQKMNVGEKNEFTGAEVTDFEAIDEGFYLLVDTSKNQIEPGDRYNVSFIVESDSGLTKKRELVSTSFRVVERRIDVARPGPGEKIVVDDETPITGTTTLTPGTIINVTVRDDELPPVHMSRTVRVTPNRTFSASFGFSDLEAGRNFEVRFPDQNLNIPGVVEIKRTTTTTTTTNRTTTTTNRTTTTTPPTTNVTTTPPPTTNTTTTTAEGLTQVPVGGTAEPLTQRAVVATTTGSSGGSIPGFGPVASVVAVVAAALLAARRR